MNRYAIIRMGEERKRNFPLSRPNWKKMCEVQAKSMEDALRLYSEGLPEGWHSISIVWATRTNNPSLRATFKSRSEATFVASRRF